MHYISREDYLRTMYHLYEKGRDIKSIEIAKELDISKASVSEMIRKLSKEGYIVVKPYSSIRFTEKGLTEAKRMMRNHRVIEVFLKNVLDYNIVDVHDEAHRLEHAFSEESIKRLNDFLKNPIVSPYGNPIPRK